MKVFAEGETIIQQGGKGSTFYILIKGGLAVYRDGVKIAEYTEPGTVVGEIAAILNIPRTATIVTTGTTELLEVEGRIDEEIRSNPDIILYVLLNLAERLSKTTGDYISSASLSRFKALNNLMQPLYKK